MQCNLWLSHTLIVSNRHPFKRSENRCLHFCGGPVDWKCPRDVVDEHIFQVSASFHWRYYGWVRSLTLFNFLQMFLLMVVRRDDVNFKNRENCMFIGTINQTKSNFIIIIIQIIELTEKLCLLLQEVDTYILSK